MDQYTVETGLTADGTPVIKCSPDFYDELVLECRELLEQSARQNNLKVFAEYLPAIAALASMPIIAETKN